MPEQLLAGVAKTIITPSAGIDMGGYGGRPGPAEGVHDDLVGAALCLEAGETVIAMTADLVGLDRESVAEIRERIAERTECPAANVMITCSHTHAGPAMPCLLSLGHPDARYVADLRQSLTDVACVAWDRRKPARVASMRVPIAFGMNRRDGNRGAESEDGVDRGTIQPHVDVLRVDGQAGAPLAVWMCCPAHPVTLRHDNLLFSADWVGYARRTVEQSLPGTVALFAQGCAGNIVSWPHGGTYEECQRQGTAFAQAVCARVDAPSADRALSVACNSEVLQLPLFDPPPPDQARAILDQCRAARDEKWDKSNYGWRQLLSGDVEWAERLVSLAETGATGLTVNYEVQAVRVGDFAVVGLDGEVFVEYALGIDTASPLAQTAVAAYTNGDIGYVPTAAAYETGGYEVETAIRYYGTTMLEPASERLITESALRLLRHLHGRSC